MRKGISTGLTLLIVFLVGAFALSAGMFMVQPRVTTVAPEEADGEWDTLQAPQEVAGSDLTVAEQSITDNANYPNAMNVTYDLNGTDGSDSNLALGIEVSSNRLENVDIQGKLDAVTTSQVAIRNAYIVPDKEGNNLDATDAIYTADVETEQDEFNFDVSSLPEGEYVLNIDLKSISTSGIASGVDLVNLDFDASTSNDVEAFSADIQNK